MKFISSQISYFIKSRNALRNVRLLLNFILLLFLLITAFSVAFHYIMEAEGREYSWITGFYWTLTVMSTLGFGDITFHSDLGRLFSIVVLLAGVFLLLVLLPFTFIQFFYAPWIEAERSSRTPRSLPEKTKDHIIITGFSAVTDSLIHMLSRHNREYTILVDDVHSAIELYDQGYKTSVGYIDDPETYRLLRADNAAMVVAANSDEINTNTAFTVREISSKVPVICTADSEFSVDILTMAGASKVLRLHDILGKSLVRRTIGGDQRANVIGTYRDLIIAETPVMKTPLVAKTLRQIKLREITGVSAVGIWERGKFSIPNADTVITPSSVLIIAGSREQIDQYELLMCIYQATSLPVIVIGYGRVGRSVVDALDKRGIAYKVIEKEAALDPLPDFLIQGDAADIDVMNRAGIKEAPTAILTTHDDATNIYLAKYCRSLNPEMQIICRANADRNVSTLHRAGADSVMSFASLGANMIYNYLESAETMMLAEGLDLFHLPVSRDMAGKSLAELNIRQLTGATVAAILDGHDIICSPDPSIFLQQGNELVLIGTTEAEHQFFKRFAS